MPPPLRSIAVQRPRPDLYHLARIRASHAHAAERSAVVALETAGSAATYAWREETRAETSERAQAFLRPFGASDTTLAGDAPQRAGLQPCRGRRPFEAARSMRERAIPHLLRGAQAAAQARSCSKLCVQSEAASRLIVSVSHAELFDSMRQTLGPTP